MFTGIIEGVGRIVAIEVDGPGSRVVIDAGPVETETLAVGDSIAVNGVCLTATSVEHGRFAADVMAETLTVTALARLGAGDGVNLERPLAADGRFDGHILQGHVDGVGIVRSVGGQRNATTIWVDVPDSVLRYCVPKGSIAVDGVSLTIVDVDDQGFSVAIIPHTWDHTILGVVTAGAVVNLEADVIAKYVERLMAKREMGSR